MVQYHTFHEELRSILVEEFVTRNLNRVEGRGGHSRDPCDEGKRKRAHVGDTVC